MSISEIIPSSPQISNRIQLVSNSVSEKLLSKFCDVSEFNFNFTQSALWSPPVQRNVFLSSSGKIITEHEMVAKLHSKTNRPRLSFNVSLLVFSKKMLTCLMFTWHWNFTICCRFRSNLFLLIDYRLNNFFFFFFFFFTERILYHNLIITQIYRINI
ncbi:hypothetical protein ACJIZ3_006140 [Penstemon smallii]|uniref:Uncharacterized protein n=1 Tax=Penstemon smallii TaxID=265156 RepID=A0ABD3S6V6_9LAMI